VNLRSSNHTKTQKVLLAEDDELIRELVSAYLQRLGYEVGSEQSNDLATLIGIVQTAGTKYVGIVLNAAAFTHFAWGLHDALKSVGLPVVEVHLSNPAAREPWRHESVIAPVAIGTIAGFGGESYVLGIEALTRHLEKQ